MRNFRHFMESFETCEEVASGLIHYMNRLLVSTIVLQRVIKSPSSEQKKEDILSLRDEIIELEDNIFYDMAFLTRRATPEEQAFVVAEILREINIHTFFDHVHLPELEAFIWEHGAKAPSLGKDWKNHANSLQWTGDGKTGDGKEVNKFSFPQPKKITNHAGDGAGVFLVAKHTYEHFAIGKPILVCLRAAGMRDPLTYASWGGKIEMGESPLDAAMAELREESGYSGNVTLVPDGYHTSELKDSNGYISFVFHNYLATVDHQFDPKIQKHEVAEAKWMSLDELMSLPKPSGETLRDMKHNNRPGQMHWGLAAYLEARKEVIKKVVGESVKS